MMGIPPPGQLGEARWQSVCSLELFDDTLTG